MYIQQGEYFLSKLTGDSTKGTLNPKFSINPDHALELTDDILRSAGFTKASSVASFLASYQLGATNAKVLLKKP